MAARPTLSSRLLAPALLAALALTAVGPPAVAGDRADPPRPSDQVRAERDAVLLELADLADRAETAQAAVVSGQSRVRAVDRRARAARDVLAAHAVELYVHGVTARARLTPVPAAADLAPSLSGLEIGLGDAIVSQAEAVHQVRQAADASRRALDDLERQRDAARVLVERVERRRADVEAELLRAVHVEEAARREAAARAAALQARAGDPPPVPATRRHRLATQRQSELMARWPFGPQPGLPTGFAPTGEVVEGVASWYGPGFHGRATASGAVYDQFGWTVAHRDLPLGTVLWLEGPTTAPGTGVLVLVNDRGPYVDGRVLDLSYAVARAVGITGLGWVRATVVTPPDQ